VGPQSAGASPGPNCYDTGGEEVTVTDADLVLGIIAPDYFLGGKKTLHKQKAFKSLQEKIARPLGMDPVEAAAGIFDITNSTMADLIRRQVVRTGYLPEEFVIYSFGGAGAVHAAGVGVELGIQRIYIFPTSPVFSAFGITAADVIHTRVVSCQYLLPLNPVEINKRLEAIEEEMVQTMGREGFPPAQVEFRRFFTMRYRRQTAGVELPVPWECLSGDRLESLRGEFERRYEDLYGIGAGYTEAGIEVSAIRLDAIGKVSKPQLREVQAEKTNLSKAKKGKRQVFFTRPQRGWIETSVYDYALLSPEDIVAGPAVIEMPFTTALVPPNSQVTIDPYRNLILEMPS